MIWLLPHLLPLSRQQSKLSLFTSLPVCRRSSLLTAWLLIHENCTIRHECSMVLIIAVWDCKNVYIVRTITYEGGFQMQTMNAEPISNYQIFFLGMKNNWILSEATVYSSGTILNICFSLISVPGDLNATFITPKSIFGLNLKISVLILYYPRSLWSLTSGLLSLLSSFRLFFVFTTL